jgi:very-short-patch-repair endonuclease
VGHPSAPARSGARFNPQLPPAAPAGDRRAQADIPRCHDAPRHPVTTPPATLTDLATTLGEDQLESAINEADKRNLTTPVGLRASLDDLIARPGTARLRRILDRHTFSRTDSALERALLRIVHEIGLPLPHTQARVNGYRVDFYWPDLGLIVETDGLRYHRTPAQQATDRRRDQVHSATGLTTLRFTHAQVTHESRHVGATLRAVADPRRGYS